MRRAFLAFALLVFGGIAAAQEPVAPADARAVREVIEAQLAAFRRDDGEAAFALASDGIRATFRTAEVFMAMVRRSYRAVYRPRSVIFEAPVRVEGTLVQPVRLTDAEGRAWIAFYPMVRGEDGRWRTDGCQLRRAPGTAV